MVLQDNLPLPLTQFALLTGYALILSNAIHLPLLVTTTVAQHLVKETTVRLISLARLALRTWTVFKMVVSSLTNPCAIFPAVLALTAAQTATAMQLEQF